MRLITMSSNPANWLSRMLWSAVIFLALIGVLASVHRTLALSFPARFSGGPPQAQAFGAGFRRREIAAHREYMIRAFAIGLAISTIRPIVGTFFATSPFTRLTPQQFFGTAFWIGFTLHLIAAEAWIHHTRPAALLRPQPSAD
jgi:hypothetical protein